MKREVPRRVVHPARHLTERSLFEIVYGSATIRAARAAAAVATGP